MFADLDLKPFYLNEIPDLENITSTHIFKPGQIIFYEGHIPYGLFILLEGTVELFKDNISEKIKSGVILGINAFLNTNNYSGTVKALTCCKVKFLSRSAFQEINNNNYQFMSWLNK